MNKTQKKKNTYKIGDTYFGNNVTVIGAKNIMFVVVWILLKFFVFNKNAFIFVTSFHVYFRGKKL